MIKNGTKTEQRYILFKPEAVDSKCSSDLMNDWGCKMHI